MLSFTLSGKHILKLIQMHMHIHNYNKCITITDIRNFMHSYHGLIQVLKLITGLCLFRDSRRSYRAYSYAGLIPVTDITFIRDSRRSYGTYLMQDLYL